MCPYPNHYASSTAGVNQPMFLRQLSSLGSSFLPQSQPPLLRAGFRSSASSLCSSHLPLFPTPHPWWLAQGCPSRPPNLLPSHPVRHLSGRRRTPHRHSIPPGNIAGGWHPPPHPLGLLLFHGSGQRSLHLSPGLMERPDRDGEPPCKRRSTEEKRRAEDRDRHRGGAPERTGGKAEETRTGSRERHKDRTELKDSVRRDGAPDRARSVQNQREHKEPWPAGPRTQAYRPKPPGQDPSSTHSPKPNPWFRAGGKELAGGGQQQAGRGGNRGGPEGCTDRTKEGRPSRELPPQPHSAPHSPNPWNIAGARQPPPPGVSPPVRPQAQIKPAGRLQRHWEVNPACSTGLQPPGVANSAFDFSVLSYNILSQELLHDNAYLYRHCEPGVLPWDRRLPNLLAEIQHYNADILCLQEVQHDHYETQIKPALQMLGYQCEYKKRTGRKPDGCAVVFKSSRLSLLSSNPVEFLRQGDTLLDRDNVGLVLLLRPNDTSGQPDPSACICVANTHLLYNPRRGDIKLAQLAILLAEISRLSRLPDGTTSPVVLCGDFNSTPWSPLYSFLTTGCLTYNGLPIGKVSGQEDSPRGQRVLVSPLWSRSLGISPQCQYDHKPTTEPGTSSPTGTSNPTGTSSPTGVEGAISSLTVEDITAKAIAAHNRIEHSVKLQSSYQHLLMHDGRPEITTCHSRTAMTVDYILYTPDSSTSSSVPVGWGLQLLGRLSLVGQSELEEVNGLPNQHHSSDHLPLLARFRLRH